jgi:hypothetical protein
MENKLLVEFDVEKTIPREFNYEEKLLRFKGSNIRYKAITKQGTLAAIVGRFYTLVPNEEVVGHIETIAKEKNLQLETLYYDWRMYCLLKDVENGVGVMVSNSVDGTIALRADSMIRNENSYTILVGTKIKNIYKRHSSNLTVGELSKEVDEVYKTALEYKTVLAKLNDYKFLDYYDGIKSLIESSKIPEIYTKGVLIKYWINKEPTIKEMYETISQRIWVKPNDMRTKLILFKKLNDIILSIGIINAL